MKKEDFKPYLAVFENGEWKAPLKTSFHTHTNYCDGENTPREMAEEAVRLGFSAIGFTGHSYTFFDESYCMSKEATQRYYREIENLKEEFEGRIRIFRGIEQDAYSKEPTEGYDYVIGSVHYIKKDGEYLPVDVSPELLRKNAEKHFNGDVLAFAETYFETVAKVREMTDCQIIGHFDLISKFTEQDDFIDTSDPRYIKAADRAADILLKTGCIFEINYGAVIKGYRSERYPEQRILEKLRKGGAEFLITADCHDKKKLLFP